MDKLIDKILQISNEKEGKTKLQLTVKIMEELGELAEATSNDIHKWSKP